MSGNFGHGILDSFDPLNIFGGSSSSIGGNLVDPGNLLGMNSTPFNGGNMLTPGILPQPQNGVPIIPGGGAGQLNVTGAFSPYASNLPANYQNPGFGSPSMSGYGYGYYGGQAPIPQGGYYNQMAQMMAGPSYAPIGSQWGQLAPGQPWNSNAASMPGYAKNALGLSPFTGQGLPGIVGKGGITLPPQPGQPIGALPTGPGGISTAPASVLGSPNVPPPVAPVQLPVSQSPALNFNTPALGQQISSLQGPGGWRSNIIPFGPHIFTHPF